MPTSIDVPFLITHRGGAGHGPENTLAAIRIAKEKSAQWIEFDVQLTQDGYPVLFHDAMLDRTTTGSGRLSDHTLAELKELDAGKYFSEAFAGEQIPTLEEAIKLCAELELGMNIEFKHSEERGQALVAETLKLVAKNWPDHLTPPLYSSYEFSTLAHLRKMDDHVFIGFLVADWEAQYLAMAKALNCYSVHLPISQITDHGVKFIQSAGYKVLTFTINDVDLADKLLKLGVDSIFSDISDLL